MNVPFIRAQRYGKILKSHLTIPGKFILIFFTILPLTTKHDSIEESNGK